MQNWLALFALVTLLSSPALATEEIDMETAPDLNASLNDSLIPSSPLAEAAKPQPENMTDSHDVDLKLTEGPVYLGENGLPLAIQPN